jgi:ActR/RegA family two-component response regulator
VTAGATDITGLTAPRGTLRVLAAVTDAAVLRTIERACSAEHHSFLFATDVQEAIATGTAEQPDLAFVDVTLDDDAGLALVHHLPAVCHHASVYAIIPPRRLELGSQAMALGAAGILMAPPSGDGLLLAISEVRGRRAAAEERARTLAELAVWKRQGELLQGIAMLAGEPDRARSALVIAEALAEASRASGAAVYGVVGDDPGDQARLAAVGSASLHGDDVALVHVAEGVTRVPLLVGGRVVGTVLFDNPSADNDEHLRALVHVASAVLGAWPSQGRVVLGAGPQAESATRVYPFVQFEDAATRELEKAKRHGRRVALATLVAPEPRGDKLEEFLLGVVRESDVLGRGARGEYFLLLPETGALGAHACRRRVLRLAGPQGEAEDRRNAPGSAPFEHALTIGVATYPHDGAGLDALIEKARRRAEETTRSVVRSQGLGARLLGEIVDSLLDAPLLEAMTSEPPFSRAKLTVHGAHALVAAACSEAARGGGATLLVALRPDSGTLAVVKAVADDPVVTLHSIDASQLVASGGAEIVILVAEHGTWAYCARRSGQEVLAAHSADPLLADVLADRLARAAGLKLS